MPSLIETKYVVEDEKKATELINVNKDLHPVEVKKETSLELNLKDLPEEDEEFDEDTYNFFLEFLKNNKEHPSKAKVEKILELLDTKITKGFTQKSVLSNKKKNEILRNLKNEYLNELEELNKQEEERKKIQKEEEEKLKKRNFRIENPFEDTLDSHERNPKKMVFASKQLKQSNDGSVTSQLKDKIIYTNQGWGVSDPIKKHPITSKNNDKILITKSKGSPKGNKLKTSKNLDKKKTLM